jgi:predicted nucleotidyltransferase
VSSGAERRLEALVDRVRGHDGLLGVLLFGSRAWGQALDERSDFDVVVIAADEAERARFEREVPFRRGDPVEVVTDTLDDLRAHAATGSDSEWARPAYLHVRVLLDKTGGELERAVHDKLVVADGTRLERAAAALDAYVNSYHRSARNRMVGLQPAARLDAAESIAPFLTFVFLLEGRVRPFNKHLAHELRERPLADAAWVADALLPRLERILDGDPAEQQALFRDVERVARAAGLGEIVDGWAPDVGWLRGERAYHEP